MIRILILALLFGLAPVLAQDAESDTSDDAATSDDTPEETSSEELYEDDFELDLGSEDYDDEDLDVFKSSVEVSFQQSVDFPTDI